jgi:pimeloyl-ACP methyl ester carboxylesterase
MTLIQTKSFQIATYSKGDPDSKKLAIVLPGRLDTKDYGSMRSHVDFLANLGFHALSFDPPGTWESPGGIELFTTTNYIKAVNELIEYFNHKPTFLMGHSRGGSVTILAGTANPSVFAIAPVMATYGEPSSPNPEAVRTGIQKSHRDLPPGDTKTKDQKEFALPISYFKDGEKYNVIAALKGCTKPKLLFYGTNDSFTKPEKLEEVFEAIPEPKALHKLNTDHDYRYHPEIIEEINKVLADFLSKIK